MVNPEPSGWDRPALDVRATACLGGGCTQRRMQSVRLPLLPVGTSTNPLELQPQRRYIRGFGGDGAVTETDGRQRCEVYYQGMVQGVGFRYTARRIAARFGVTGYVKNLPDGRVFLLAEGPSQQLDRFLAAVRAEMGRYIDDAHQSVGPATGEFRHFDIRY